MKEEKESNAFGIASLVTGILGLVLFIMPYFAIFLSITAVVLGAIQNKKRSSGMATGGLVTGIIGIIGNGLLLLFLVLLFVIGASLP